MDMNDRQVKIVYGRRRKEWLVVIYRDTPDGVRHVLTVGCEDSRSDADGWATGTLDLMNRLERDDVELPDKYERVKSHGEQG